MTGLLTRLFIKNYENGEDSTVRTACGQLAGWVGIFCNILLFIGKITIGVLSGSVSITADAINNLSDASSSIVTLLGFKLASKPADDKHPYGYYRIEYFAGLAVSVLIIFIGVELIKSSVDKIFHPEVVEFSVYIIIVLVASILLKLWMALFNTKIGKHINSAALIATAADSRNDVISTAAVLIACIIGKIFCIAIDGYIGLLVALFIIWSGIGIAKDTISPLLGEAPDEELVHKIAGEICDDEKVLGVHDLIIHDYGPGRRFASAHVEVDYREDVIETHEHIDNIEHYVKKTLGTELVLHYDPIVTDNEELNELKVKVLDILHGMDRRFALHDFRIVPGNMHTNVIFDLVIPNEYMDKTDELKEKINKSIQFGDKKYFAVITFDTDAFNDPHTR